MATANSAATLIDIQEIRREHQLELEKLYDKNQLMPRVRQAFQESLAEDFQEFLNNHGINEKFCLDLLAQMAVRKRAPVSTMIGVLRHHFPETQQVADELEKCVDAEIATFNTRYTNYGDPIHELVVIYEISEELQAELDRFQYPLPMVVQPREIKTNLDSGYLTGKSSVILRDNHHNQDVCLDHLNRMNSMKLAVNVDVAQTIQNKWKGIDKKKPDETYNDFKKRRKAFEKYDAVAKDVIGILLKEGNEIFLTHKYDKRGRTYCMGHHITYQGTDWNKAIIEFAEKEIVGD